MSKKYQSFDEFMAMVRQVFPDLQINQVQAEFTRQLLDDANLGAMIRDNEAMGFTSHSLIHNDVPLGWIEIEKEWGKDWSTKLTEIFQAQAAGEPQETWRDKESLL